jgi:hypothetical protein
MVKSKSTHHVVTSGDFGNFTDGNGVANGSFKSMIKLDY